ncbi:MAG: hypothetical protein KGS61_14445, partial [Verrucomicrobia bacterium]|nr:hypothetical protein [Verrucomicrobiota bacterium]
AGEEAYQSKTTRQREVHNPPLHDSDRGLSPIPDMPFAPATRGQEPAPARQRQYFAQMAGAGLDARAVDLVNWKTKKLLGPLAYVIAASRASLEPHPRITVSTPAETVAGELVLVGNGRFYGGRLPVFPNGSPVDGLLEVVVLPRATWFDLLRCGLALGAGRFDRLKDIRRLRADSFRLESDLPARVQVDGETVGNLPATFSVRPKALRVIVP